MQRTLIQHTHINVLRTQRTQKSTLATHNNIHNQALTNIIIAEHIRPHIIATY